MAVISGQIRGQVSAPFPELRQEEASYQEYVESTRPKLLLVLPLFTDSTSGSTAVAMNDLKPLPLGQKPSD